MHDAGAQVVRRAREQAGLTQAELAARAGVSQSVIARVERPGSNPTVGTLDHLVRAAGARLELSVTEVRLPDVDEGQILDHLRMTPAQRLARFTRQHKAMNDMLRSVRRPA